VPWLSVGALQADALGDLKTTGNELSVFAIDDTANADRVASALAAEGEHVSVFDYVLFDESIISQLAMTLVLSPGRTPDSSVNQNHRDLTQLTAAGLLDLAMALSKGGIFKRFTDRDVANRICTSIKNGHINVAVLKDVFITSLKGCCTRYSIECPLE